MTASEFEISFGGGGGGGDENILKLDCHDGCTTLQIYFLNVHFILKKFKFHTELCGL